MQPLAPGDPRAIGGYRLLARLGEGGMGQVYLARSERGRTVAVKTIQPALARESDFRARFAREVATARLVGGEWTAPVLDADTEGPAPWVATGYIAGPTLHQVVAEDHGPLPERSLAFLSFGLVQALRDIHRTGLVHRDLKPANVMITIDGPRVIDFGIARALDGGTSGGLTRTGAVIGSPGFMSPEQIRGLRLTPASDVFSLGTVLAYAATGRLPFGTGDSGGHALMFRIVEEEPDLDGVPGALRELISDCLAKAPEDRPDIAALLERTGADVPEGPWLPAEVLAQLGRHAVALLDSEDPAAGGGPPPTVPGPATPPPAMPGTAVPTLVPGAPVHPPTYLEAPPVHIRPPTTYGAVWPQPGPPAPAEPTPEPRRLSGAANLLTALFAALAVVAAIAAMLHLQLLGDLDEWQVDTPYFGDLDDNEAAESRKTTLDAFEVVWGSVQLAIVAVWLYWFWQVRRNAEAFAPGRIRYRRSRALLFWLIPVANLVLPKQIADDIWRASHSAPHPRTALVTLWWALSLGYLLFTAFVSADRWHEADTYASARTRATLGTVEQVWCLLAVLTAVLFVRRLTAMQHARITARGPA
ncbi:protein kinase domain-containing protein [Streptomyces litchfieldiae]|uniref:DUF4328 domain-containing protein n=1 Tax=Streptomyces litchfieldiae TaxID=3075543 RepID=A0ABU2MW01_9ACTN|nr:DUF4328 domain-containing protein [Streptomyces sp. DSM 44938]MDT0345023.1 DUF4328 domain-containing protein [Streptomyces sp. DSM 44938]